MQRQGRSTSRQQKITEDEELDFQFAIPVLKHASRVKRSTRLRSQKFPRAPKKEEDCGSKNCRRRERI